MTPISDTELVELLVERLGAARALERDGRKGEALFQLELLAGELELRSTGLQIAELIVAYLVDMEPNRRRQQLYYRILTALHKEAEAEALAKTFLPLTDDERAKNKAVWQVPRLPSDPDPD